MQNCKRKITSFAIFFVFSAFFGFQAFSQSKMSPSDAQKQREDFVNYSKQFIGCPYVLGGIGPSNFDCSGLVFTCSRESIGVQLPRKTSAIYNYCSEISESEKEAGDLVFFKTTGDGSVSHVGIYIGNNQFIHAASDGPNTGVIISSLRENYWKTHYYKAGRFLTSSKGAKPAVKEAASESNAASNNNENSEKVTETPVENMGIKAPSQPTSSVMKKKGNFFGKLDFEATFFLGWNFFTARNFNFVFHGTDFKAAVRYTGRWPEPFLATDIVWEYATGVVQIPIEFGIAVNPFIRLYLGPVFTIGNPHPASKLFDYDDDVEIDAMIFPGIFGLEIQSPRIKTKIFDMTFVQDFRYTFYSKTDGSALGFKEGMGNGFVFATGIRAIF